MPSHLLSRRAARITVVAVATTAFVGAMAPFAAADPPAVPPAGSAPGRYIVTLSAPPIATYNGQVQGMAATRPAAGRKVDVVSAASRRYGAYLGREQTRVAERVDAKISQRYSVSLNGFATSLTPAQARRLQRTRGVISVSKDRLVHATDDRNPVDYLRLSGREGVWASMGGTAKAGRGVVVGVIDTGIWPESKSFAGAKLGSAPPTAANPFRSYLSGGKIVVPKSDGSTFSGTCQEGEGFTRDLCNTKLVGARYFGKTFLQQNPDTDSTDYISPRDGDGHGSHTASTAAGDAGVPASIAGRRFGNISGVAPGATIASYKALWTAPDGEGGFDSDILEAIDAAVADGVDVINYSVGGATESATNDPVQLAFLSAASAGIFVAASAGNSGPGASTLDNTSPWVTTVGASTVAPYEGTVTLGNGTKRLGVTSTVTAPVGPARLATAVAVKTAAATDAAATLCSPDSLDPAKVAGKIVVCQRGVVDRVAKSAEVKRGGGVGMVLANPTVNSLDADSHTVPTIIVNPPASAAIAAYAKSAGATATLTQGNSTTTTIPYPQVAGFSSRGPALASAGDLLKPDIVAPGVAILAAVAPSSNSRRSFDFLSGTSMAAPHVAGLAALYLGQGVHPLWSAMRVKSALMTTAQDTKNADGTRLTDPYSQGAGEVDPARMLDPGLVYLSGPQDWLAYLEGLGVDTGTGVPAEDPSDYNTAAIAIGRLLDHQTVTRRVTAVTAGLYRARLSVPGFTTTVSPSILSFSSPGETKKFTVTFRRTTAPFDQAANGFLTWSGAGTTVRSPVAVTPRFVDAPATVTGSGASGAIRYPIVPGVNGQLPIKGYGLTSGAVASGSLTAGDTKEYTKLVPAGTKVAQFTIRTADTTADLALTVYRQTAAGPVPVGVSASNAADETVLLPAPEAGVYIAEVAAFSNAPGTTTTPFSYRGAAVITSSGQGGFTVTPTSPMAVAQRPITIATSWSRVDPATPYLGYVEYPDGSGTVVTVN